MKKAFLLLIAIGFSTLMFAQNNTNNIVFVFDNMDNFTTQVENKETPKEFTFTIKNINSDAEAEALKKKISNHRGVTSISISDANENGDRTANLVLYKYANYWRYYENFFSKNEINKIIINNKEYSPEQIGKQ